MADFHSFTEEEISLLSNMFDDILDKLHHYPSDFSSNEQEGYCQLNRDLYIEARKRKYWWAPREQ